MTATFTLSRDQAITGAMQLCGALDEGGTPSAQQIIDFGIFLNALLKLWEVDGYKGWCYQTLSFPAVAAKISYTIGEAASDVTNPRPVRMPAAWIQDTQGNKVPLLVKTRQGFDLMTPGNAPGPANCFYYDPQLTKGIFFPWQVPTVTEVANGCTFYCTIQRPISDITTGGQVFDVDQVLYLAVIWGLAEQIMLIVGTEENIMRRIEKNAPVYKEAAMAFLEEDGDVTFTPDFSGGGRGR